MGHAPKAPPPPKPSAQELALMEKQGKAIDVYLSDLADQKKENKSLGLLTQVSSGLYDPVYDAGGNLIDATLNRGAVDSLRSDISRSRDIGLLQADRLEKALKGELPISEGTTQRKANDFNLLKESAARRGIMIEGDSPESATSNSTSGNELVGNFKRTYGLLEDSERRGEIANVSGVNLGVPSLSLASSANAYGPGATAPGFGQAAGLLGQAQQPYQFNRQLQYQTNQQNAANSAQRNSDIAGLLGSAGGIGLGIALCFDGDSLVDTIEGQKKIKNVTLEDTLILGGKVLSVRHAKTADGTRYNYKGVVVTGYHAVNEYGKWIRVKDSLNALPLEGQGEIYSLGTENHRIVINGIEFADEFETDRFGFITLSESLDALNTQKELVYG